MPRLLRIQGLDRRHAVKDAMVVDPGGVQRLLQGEAAERASRRVIDARLAARDVDARDEQDEHIIDAIAMRPFRRRLSRDAVTRLDAELMELDMPGARCRRERAEHLAAGAENGAERRARRDL